MILHSFVFVLIFKQNLLNRLWLAARFASNLVRSNLTRIDRRKFKTIAIADMHARDIVDLFVEHHICDAKQFEWLSQLRFHWHRDVDNIFIEHYSGTL